MAKALYMLLTILESALSIVGIRATLEQPPYRVLAHLDGNIEIRSYGPLVAVETTSRGDDDAFSRLFRYIAGANARDATVAMTAPVEQKGGGRLPAGGTRDDGTSNDGTLVMRFFLPKAVSADPPPPSDPRVRIVTVPARTMAVIRFSGSFGRQNLAAHLATLEATLARTGRKADGSPLFLGYDPPFTIPFLRRNEIAIPVDP